MTTHRRSRTYLVGIAVTALLAPLAVVATLASPAAAAPGKPHEVYMYKVEKHVDLSGVRRQVPEAGRVLQRR